MSPLSLAAEKRGEGGSLALTSKKEGGGDFFCAFEGCFHAAATEEPAPS